RHLGRVRHDPADRRDRRRADAVRPLHRAALRALAHLIRSPMADITTPLAHAPARPGGLVSTETQARIVCGLAILLLWELIVRAFAPAYVAKPTGVVVAIPKVIVDPAFLNATGVTLWACAQGLAISIVFGTVIGLAMGRSELV